MPLAKLPLLPRKRRGMTCFVSGFQQRIKRKRRSKLEGKRGPLLFCLLKQRGPEAGRSDADLTPRSGVRLLLAETCNTSPADRCHAFSLNFHVKQSRSWIARPRLCNMNELSSWRPCWKDAISCIKNTHGCVSKVKIMKRVPFVFFKKMMEL